jgi:hypothetical protein
MAEIVDDDGPGQERLCRWAVFFFVWSLLDALG